MTSPKKQMARRVVNTGTILYITADSDRANIPIAYVRHRLPIDFNRPKANNFRDSGPGLLQENR